MSFCWFTLLTGWTKGDPGQGSSQEENCDSPVDKSICIAMVKKMNDISEQQSWPEMQEKDGLEILK